MNPGFWAITLSTEIATEITVKDGDSSGNQTISGQSLGHISNLRRRQLVVGHEDRLERLSFCGEGEVQMNVPPAFTATIAPPMPRVFAVA